MTETDWSKILSSPAQLESLPEDPDTAEKDGPAEVKVVSLPQVPAKGEAQTIFTNVTANQVQDGHIDMEAWNALHVVVLVTGTTPSAVVNVAGAAKGYNFVTLSDPNATRTVTANDAFDVVCGSRSARLELSSVTGSFSSGQGFTVIVTPFLAPGGEIRVPDGANEALGTTTDTPATSAEDATARTGISLWKGIKNALGITTGAAVVTDANGTIQQYLRGLVKLLVDKITVKAYTGAPSGNGEVQGNASATQCPNVACTVGVVIKAAYDNAGRIYFGLTGVTKKDGTTDTTSGLEMNAGDSQFFPVANLNQLYYICDNAGDDFTYIAF